MAKINFNFSKYDFEIRQASLDRLEKAAEAIRDKAKALLSAQIKETYKEHGPYRRRYVKGSGLIGYMSGESSAANIVYGGTAPIWTERQHGAMVKTIRVVRSKNPNINNVWVMAGNFKTWWAVQLEYGKGDWRGKKKSFLRPAMTAAAQGIRSALQGGAISEGTYHAATRKISSYMVGGV